MEINKKILSGTSRILLLAATALLIFSIFVPIWRIELDAPQYPEGLELLIYSNKLAGNVDIINGLNHYIGMKVLHTEDFIEFTILPYLIGGFALLSLVVAWRGRKTGLFVLFSAFVAFGIVAMIDFYRWEYDYGHHLNPNAAIIVPGMAYQPPLLGFKQLLNFGAFSVPAIGGWLFIVSGLVMLFATVSEMGVLRRPRKIVANIIFAAIVTSFTSCTETKPEPAILNKDQCDFCKMTISDSKFVAELITNKGRIYKFDDLSCLINYKKENSNSKEASCFVADFENDSQFLNVRNAYFVTGENINSPMGGNTVVDFFNPIVS